jgi:CubicO group peptidase (beta-lactamase class C family)/acetyl esterase/lipase
MKTAHRILLAGVTFAALIAAPTVVGWSAEPAPKTLASGKPADVGMNGDKLAKIPTAMQQYIDRKQLAGAVTLVARQGKIVQLEAVGYADVENSLPMTKDSIFAIASMTKPITATAVMILQDEGKLSVSDPVSKYIPQFKDVQLAGKPPAREITIRDLMTHTAGLSRPPRKEGDAPPSLKETSERIASQPLQFEPGSRWQYGDGLTVCGRIVEIVSGQSFDEFLKERIFTPLKMNDTTFQLTAEQKPRLARLYKRGKDKTSIEKVEGFDPTMRRTPNPSGGLFSTATDMARFYQMVLAGGELDGKRIVSQAAAKEMTRLQTGEIVTGFTPGCGWGLGWCLVQQPQGVTKMLSAGAYGHGGAFGTQGWVDAKRDLICVLMIQRSDFGGSDDSDVRASFQDLAVAAITEQANAGEGAAPTTTASSTTPADKLLTLNVWPGAVPGEKGDIGPENYQDQQGAKPIKRLANVSQPTITVFPAPADKNTGAAVLICPGGGYNILAMDLEGDEVATWLNSIGVTGVVLKYRVPRRKNQPAHLAPLQDAQRAMSVVRSHAAEWKIDPKRIGILGFSAGGHLSAAASTNYDQRQYDVIDDTDKLSCRPDFAVLVYPAYLMDKENKLAPEIRVTSDSPPTFFVHAGDDRILPENSVTMYLALRQEKVPAEMHLFVDGGHGFGLRPTASPSSTWPASCEEWMKVRGLLTKSN